MVITSQGYSNSAIFFTVCICFLALQVLNQHAVFYWCYLFGKVARSVMLGAVPYIKHHLDAES